MLIAETTYLTLRAMESMPRLQCIVKERRDDGSYHCRGLQRQLERHCLFKYTLAGEGVFLDAKGEHRLPPGTGFLCEINDIETEYYYPKDGKEPWVFLFSCFIGPTATALARDLVNRHGAIFKIDLDSPIISAMLSECTALHNERTISASNGAETVFKLLCSLDESMNRMAEASDVSMHLVRKAIALINESLPGGMSVAELAEALEVSREHLSRVFVQVANSTPHEYITRLRMLKACHLLKESSLGIKGVSEAVGIEIPQHFSRLFKKTIKMTPREFRLHGAIPILDR